MARVHDCECGHRVVTLVRVRERTFCEACGRALRVARADPWTDEMPSLEVLHHRAELALEHPWVGRAAPGWVPRLVGAIVVLLLAPWVWEFFYDTDVSSHRVADLVRSPESPDAPFATFDELEREVLEALARRGHDVDVERALRPSLAVRGNWFEHRAVEKELTRLRDSATLDVGGPSAPPR